MLFNQCNTSNKKTAKKVFHDKDLSVDLKKDSVKAEENMVEEVKKSILLNEYSSFVMHRLKMAPEKLNRADPACVFR